MIRAESNSKQTHGRHHPLAAIASSWHDLRLLPGVFLALSLPAGLCFATVFPVSPGESIQVAIDCASDGDTVLIEDGTYHQATVLYGKALCIASRYLIDQDTSHITATVISPDSSRPDTASCFVYAYGEGDGSRLIGLSLQDGTGTYSDFSFQRNGGAIYLQGPNLSIEHCRFADSRAYAGGAILVAYDHAGRHSTCWVNDCVIERCVASEMGGGICVVGGGLEARRVDFIADTVYNRISGAAITAMPTYSLIDSCRFVGNIGGTGAVAITTGNNVLMNCVFANNGCPPDVFFEMQLTDLWICCSNTRVQGCLFDGNFTDNTMALLSEDYQDTRLDFVGNVVRNRHMFDPAIADHIGIENHRNGEFAYNIFRDNTSLDATILNIVDNVRRVHHNVLFNNRAVTPGTGSAAYVGSLGYDELVIDSNLVAGNSSPAISSWVDAYGVPLSVHAENNWWGDPSGPYHPTLNPGGQGDTLLSDSVLFIPWLTEPPDTTMPDDYLTAREHPEVARTWVLMDAFPNPFNQSVTLVLAGFAGNDFEIGLYNLLGQMVDVVHRGALTGGQITYQAPPHLASGVYLLSAHDQHGVQTKKVILLK